ncbi:MAG: hypothetical protein AAF383_27360, partial [Cyanobacteria bacterium P01_A01_bin.83]
MVAKITYFKIDEFKKKGEFNQYGSECKINELFFRKGDTLTHQEIKQVLDTCNKYKKFDINTLIVKGEHDLTIWIEEKSKRPTAIFDQDTEATRQTVSNSQSLPTKTVTKRYRGQVYEEEVVDWAAIQQMNQQDKPRRKYRGQY